MEYHEVIKKAYEQQKKNEDIKKNLSDSKTKVSLEAQKPKKEISANVKAALEKMEKQEKVKKATMIKLKQEQAAKKEGSSLKIPSALLTHQAKAGLEKKIDMNNLFKSNKRVAWLPSYATPNMLEILKERDAVKRERDKMIQEEIIAKKNDAAEEERKRRKVKEIMLKLNLNKPQLGDIKKRKLEDDNDVNSSSSEKKPKKNIIETDHSLNKIKKSESEQKKNSFKKVKSTNFQPISFEQLMKQAEDNKNKPIEDQEFLDSINSCSNDIIFKRTNPNTVKADPLNNPKPASSTPYIPIKPSLSNTNNSNKNPNTNNSNKNPNTNNSNKNPNTNNSNMNSTENVKKDYVQDKLKKDPAKKTNHENDNQKFTSNNYDKKLINKKHEQKESTNTSESVKLKATANGKVNSNKLNNSKDNKKRSLMEKMLEQLKEMKGSGLNVENFIDELKSYVTNKNNSTNNNNNNTTNSNKNKNSLNGVKMKESASVKKPSESFKSKPNILENKSNSKDYRKTENNQVKSKSNEQILSAWDRMMMERGIKMEPISNKTKKKHVNYDDDDEEDEYEEDFVDDEIDEDDEYSQNFSSHIKDIFKYNRYSFKNENPYDDLKSMESSARQILYEDRISTKIGIKEDLEEYRKEQEMKRLKNKK